MIDCHFFVASACEIFFTSVPRHIGRTRLRVNNEHVDDNCRMFLLQREFKTLYSLKKNTTQHHDDVYDDGIVPVFKDSTGNEVERPQARNTLDAESQQAYMLWLSGLIERLNSTFRPRLPVKIENDPSNRTVIKSGCL